MKAKFISKIFFLFICLLVFVPAISAQEKPQALKFDEFEEVAENQLYTDRDEITFSERVKRFSNQLEKSRGTRAYIIFYRARISYQTFEWQDFGNKVYGIRNQILYNQRIKVKDVVVINGGYRENNSVEFWIVPENVELPAPTPAFDKWETYVCPIIYVGNYTSPGENGTVRFSVQQDNFKGINEYSLTWRVSAGEIVSGQKTNNIEVRVNDADKKRITAYVEVGGLPFPCPKVFSATAERNGKLYQADSFGLVANGDLKARLQNFMIEVSNYPTAKGHIIIYANRDLGAKDMERQYRRVKEFFAFLRLDLSRVTITRGGYNDTSGFDFWLSFDDAVPIPTPTVDKKFIETPNQTRKPRPRKK